MDQLLIALDVDTREQAFLLADQLRGVVGGFKIGSRLYTAEGPSVVEALAAQGDRIFLDLKFHDIPHTVAAAVSAAARQGVWMLTVHAAGGREMMRAAKAAAGTAENSPLIVAITVLTSLDHGDLDTLGVNRSLPDQVVALADLARQAGIDGVVASPLEVRAIRERCASPFLIVTPGIRSGATRETSAGGMADDQTRTASAAAAIEAGADYIVVGRPVIHAPDPKAAAMRIARECR